MRLRSLPAFLALALVTTATAAGAQVRQSCPSSSRAKPSTVAAPVLNWEDTTALIGTLISVGWSDAFAERLAAFGAPLLPRLRQLTVDIDPQVRARAASVIGVIGHTAKFTRPFLLERLRRDSSARVVPTLAWAAVRVAPVDSVVAQPVLVTFRSYIARHAGQAHGGGGLLCQPLDFPADLLSAVAGLGSLARSAAPLVPSIVPEILAACEMGYGPEGSENALRILVLASDDTALVMPELLRVIDTPACGDMSPDHWGSLADDATELLTRYGALAGDSLATRVGRGLDVQGVPALRALTRFPDHGIPIYQKVLDTNDSQGIAVLAAANLPLFGRRAKEFIPFLGKLLDEHRGPMNTREVLQQLRSLP